MPNVLSNKNTLANRNALNRAKLAREMTHDFSASGVPNEGQRFRDLVNDARGFVADMSPGYGDVLASQRASQAYGQAWDALKGGDLGQALGRGAEGLTEHLSIIPGIGDIATMGKAATGVLPGLVAMTREIPAPLWNKKLKSLPLSENPSRREIQKLFKESGQDTLRVLEADGKTWVWPADDALHEDIGLYLGLDKSKAEYGLIRKEDF